MSVVCKNIRFLRISRCFVKISMKYALLRQYYKFLRRKLQFLSEKQSFFAILITYNYTILRPHKLIAGTITLCTLYFSMLSCSGPDSRLEQALTLAGSNRPELEKVLRRYSSPEDSLKYRAAVFLIENMPGYGYYEGPALDSFLEYYPLLRSVRLKKQSPDVAVDSINRKYGKFDLSSLHYKEDIRTVDSAYLFNNCSILSFPRKSTFPVSPFNS